MSESSGGNIINFGAFKKGAPVEGEPTPAEVFRKEVLTSIGNPLIPFLHLPKAAAIALRLGNVPLATELFKGFIHSADNLFSIEIPKNSTLAVHLDAELVFKNLTEFGRAIEEGAFTRKEVEAVELLQQAATAEIVRIKSLVEKHHPRENVVLGLETTSVLEQEKQIDEKVVELGRQARSKTLQKKEIDRMFILDATPQRLTLRAIAVERLLPLLLHHPMYITSMYGQSAVQLIEESPSVGTYARVLDLFAAALIDAEYPEQNRASLLTELKRALNYRYEQLQQEPEGEAKKNAQGVIETFWTDLLIALEKENAHTVTIETRGTGNPASPISPALRAIHILSQRVRAGVKFYKSPEAAKALCDWYEQEAKEDVSLDLSLIAHIGAHLYRFGTAGDSEAMKRYDEIRMLLTNEMHVSDEARDAYLILLAKSGQPIDTVAAPYEWETIAMIGASLRSPELLSTAYKLLESTGVAKNFNTDNATWNSMLTLYAEMEKYAKK